MSGRARSLGIYNRSLPGGDRLDALAALRAVRSLGFDGCLFASPLAISPTLDAGELREARALATDLDLVLGVGVGRIHPYHFDRESDVLALGDGDFRSGLIRLMQAALDLDCHELWFSVGTLADRMDRSTPWAAQLMAVEAFLRSFSPVLRGHGCRLNLKTHEEITSFEVVRLVEATGADVLGVSLDPVNVLVRGEDPVSAARRVAPYVHHVHLDDAVLRFRDDGVERKLYPLGSGTIDWSAILQLLDARAPSAALWIELHRGQFTIPLFDRDWLAAQPELSLADVAAVTRLAVLSDQRLARGEIPPPEPHQLEPTLRLAQTRAHLRSLGIGHSG